MALCARLLEDDGFEVVAFIAVVVVVFLGLAQLGFEPRDGLRGFAFLFLAAGAEAGRGAGVAFSFFVGDFGGGLHFDGDADVVALL